METKTRYYRELAKLRAIRQEIVKWLCMLFLICIIQSVLGGYKTGALLLLVLLAYGMTKQMLEYHSNKVISDKQVVFLLIMGFLSFLGIVQIITELY